MKQIFFMILLGFVFVQCSPKVKTNVVSQPQENKDFRAVAPAPQPAPEIKFGDYDVITLDNGLKVIIVENHKIPKVTMRLFLDRKPVLEGDKAGYIEFMGELLSRGSKNRDKAELDEQLDFLGASFSTFSQGFYLSGLSKYADEMLSIASDAVLNPVFPKDEFEKIKTQKLSELAQAKEDPNTISSNVSSVVNYGKNHPYGEMVTEETVNNITLNDCIDYYNKSFNPSNGYLVFVGDIDDDEARELSEKYFKNWKSKNLEEQSFGGVNPPAKTVVDFVPKRGAVQSVIAVTYPVDLKPENPDLIKSRVMNTLLGGFFRSRLNQNLREDHAYTYGIRSSLRDDPYSGEFMARASVRNEVTDSALYQVLYEINRLRTEMVPEKELNLVKSVMTGSFGRSLEDPRTIANFALKTERLGLPKNFYHDYLKNLSKVTSQDIMDMAKKYLKPDNANIVVVGDKSTVAEKLKTFGDLKFFDPFGNELVEDKATGESMDLDKLYGKNGEALGGFDKLKSVKTLETEYVATIQGMEMKMWELKENGKKSATKMEMMGQVMQEQRFDGEKGLQIIQGQKKPMSDDEIRDIKSDTYVFPVCGLKHDDKVSFAGSENVDGEKYYIVEQKSGDKSTVYFFNAKTFLLDRVEINVSANGRQQKIIQKFLDYKPHDGVLLPEKIKMSGAMPMEIEFNLTKAIVNGDVAPDVFKVD